jgi:hypothetical protein
MQRLDTLSFAIGERFTEQLSWRWSRSRALVGIPGLRPFADLLTQFYRPYGYSVSPFGVVAGAIWGLIEGFVHFGIFALLYNLVLGRVRS